MSFPRIVWNTVQFREIHIHNSNVSIWWDVDFFEAPNTCSTHSCAHTPDPIYRSSFEADAFFPEVDSTQWDLVEEEKHHSSFDQPYDYSYLTYKKKTK